MTKQTRKKEARFIASDEEHDTIERAAAARNLKPATYMRAVVLRQARRDCARSAA